MFNKIKYLFFIWLAWISLKVQAAEEYINNMIPSNGNGVTTDKLNTWKGDGWIDSISKWVVDSIDFLLPITAVGVFLFVGIRLAIAQWNPEEFKKSWMQFMYAVIWIFIVSFAWAAVKLVWGLNL